MLSEPNHNSESSRLSASISELEILNTKTSTAIEANKLPQALDLTNKSLALVSSLADKPVNITGKIYFFRSLIFRMSNKFAECLEATSVGLSYLQNATGLNQNFIKTQLLFERAVALAAQSQPDDAIRALTTGCKLLRRRISSDELPTKLAEPELTHSCRRMLAAMCFNLGVLYQTKAAPRLQIRAQSYLRYANKYYERSFVLNWMYENPDYQTAQQIGVQCGDMLVSSGNLAKGMSCYKSAYDVGILRFQNVKQQEIPGVDREELIALLRKLVIGYTQLKNADAAQTANHNLQNLFKSIAIPTTNDMAKYFQHEAHVAKAEGRAGDALLALTKSLEFGLKLNPKPEAVIAVILEGASLSRTAKEGTHDFRLLAKVVANNQSLPPAQRITILQSATQDLRRQKCFAHIFPTQQVLLTLLKKSGLSHTFDASLLRVHMAEQFISRGKYLEALTYLNKTLLTCPIVPKVRYLAMRLQVLRLKRTIEDAVRTPHDKKEITVRKLSKLQTEFNPSPETTAYLHRAKLYLAIENDDQAAADNAKADLLSNNEKLALTEPRGDAERRLNLAALGELSASCGNFGAAEEQFSYLLSFVPDSSAFQTKELVDLLTKAGIFYASHFEAGNGKYHKRNALDCFLKAETIFAKLRIRSDNYQLMRLRGLKKLLNAEKVPNLARKIGRKLQKVTQRAADDQLNSE